MVLRTGFLVCLLCIIEIKCVRPWRNMDERQRTLGVHDDVESLGRNRVDMDRYLVETTQPEEVGSRVGLEAASRHVLASEAEMVSRLMKSRSGHQGRLTHINNQISPLLYDSNNIAVVQELREIFERQWERFTLVHEDILIYVANDSLAVANAKATFNEQANRRAELLEKISQYLSNEVATNGERKQSNLSRTKSETDFETISHASLGSLATFTSAKSAASARSVEKRQMRERAELSIKQLRERQRVERDAEMRILEAQQALKQQTFRERLEIAKLEEKYAIEAEQRLCFDNEWANLNDVKAPEFEYRSALLPNKDLHDSKAFVQNNKHLNKATGHGQAAPDNGVQHLAETLANLANAPPIEVIKFTGDPKDYLRFVNRFEDQVLSQPMSESKKTHSFNSVSRRASQRSCEKIRRYGPGPD